MAGRVRDGERRFARQGLDRALTLREQVEELEPSRAVDGPGDATELRVKPVLELAVLHGNYSMTQLINCQG